MEEKPGKAAGSAKPTSLSAAPQQRMGSFNSCSPGSPSGNSDPSMWRGAFPSLPSVSPLYCVEIQSPWGQMILKGKKVVETRTYPFPSPLLNHAVLVMEKTAGKHTPGVSAIPDRVPSQAPELKIVGELVVVSCIQYKTKAEWDGDVERHRVYPKTGYGFKENVNMYGWEIGAVLQYKHPRKVPEMQRIKRSVFKVLRREEWEGKGKVTAPLDEAAAGAGAGKSPREISREKSGAEGGGEGPGKKLALVAALARMSRREGVVKPSDPANSDKNVGQGNAAGGGGDDDDDEREDSKKAKEDSKKAKEDSKKEKKEKDKRLKKQKPLVVALEGGGGLEIPQSLVSVLQEAVREGMSEAVVRHRLRDVLGDLSQAVVQAQPEHIRPQVVVVPAGEDERQPVRLVAVSGSVQVNNGICSALGWFPSISLSGVWLHSGKFYFEVNLVDFDAERKVVGLFGWGDEQFRGKSDEGLGVGCDAHSWAWDGRRAQKFHTTGEQSLENAKTQAKARPFGSVLKSGDVLGLAADLDNKQLHYSLNGSWEGPFGLAFDNFVFKGGIRPIVTITSNIRVDINFGNRPFSHRPPSPQHRPIFEGELQTRGVLRDAFAGVASSTSRRNYMRTLEEMIGPKTSVDWKSEILSLTGRSLEDRLNDQSDAARYKQCMERGGWGLDEAVVLVAGFNFSTPLGKAIKEHKTDFVAFTYTLYETLIHRAVKDKLVVEGGAGQRLGDGKEEGENAMFYRPWSDLIQCNPAWLDILRPDHTGFKGFTSNEPIIVYPGALFQSHDDQLMVDQSHNVYDTKSDADAEQPFHVVDDALIRFVSPPQDDTGVHCPVMLDTNNFVFPPLTLFRVVGDDHILSVNGHTFKNHHVMTVLPTYLLSPTLTNYNVTAGKFSTNTTYLGYGSRDEYVRGVDEILADPVLSMEEEFLRNDKWQVLVPSKGVMVEFCAVDEWKYVTHAAETRHTHNGWRDPGENNGMTVENFVDRVNKWVREHGGGEELLLTREEVIAVRLYSGPAFKPINQFLREVAKLSPEWRFKVSHNADLTYACTVSYIYSAIRKLSKIRDDKSEFQTLFRGVRGALPHKFFKPDEMGLISATDFGFMSTSKSAQTPIHYMNGESNVLWEIHCRKEDVAIHNGGDIRLLSQYPDEDEVLFPPLTMLQVEKAADCAHGHANAKHGHGHDHGHHDKPPNPEHEFAVSNEDHTGKDGRHIKFKRIHAVPYFV